MNRRQFLTSALASVPVIAAPAALLEALVPKRTIFLPPRGGWIGADSPMTATEVLMRRAHMACNPPLVVWGEMTTDIMVFGAGAVKWADGRFEHVPVEKWMVRE